MALITFADKQAMGTQPSIPEVNKITDNNINEIKSVVNNNANLLSNSTAYSTTEQVVGTWTNEDGTEQPLYRKIVYFTGTQMVTGAWIGFVPVANVETLSKCQIGANDNNTIAVWTDVATSYSNGYVRYYSPSLAHYCNYVILEYTKTTD